MTILQPNSLAKRAAWLLGGAIIFVYLYGLGTLPFLGPDEPRYAQVGHEMWARGDWVTPTLGGHPWFEKPSLLYWLEMVSYQLFGVSEGAARLGPALCGLLTILGLRVASGGTHQTTASSLLLPPSAIVLATSLGLLAFSRGASFDIVLTMTVTAALACFWRAETAVGTWARRGWQLGWWACLGLATLAKGLAGLILPGGIVFFYFVLRRAWPARDWWKSVLWGVPVLLAVAATWYGPVIKRHGWAFVDEFFLQHHLARYTSNKYKHPGPVWYYLPVLLGLALPWGAFLIKGLLAARQWDWRGVENVDKGRVLALAWLAWPVLFFSLSGSKLPGYILPALPGAAWLAGEQVARWQNGDNLKWPARVTGGLFLLFAAGMLVYAQVTGLVSWRCVLVAALPVTGAGAWVWVWPSARAGVWTLAGAVLFAFAWPQHCDLSGIIRRETVKGLLQQADARGYGALTVHHLHAIEHGSWFYANGRVACDEKGAALKFEGAVQVRDAIRQRGGPVLVFVPLEHLGQLTNNPEIKAEVIGDNGWIALVAAR